MSLDELLPAIQSLSQAEKFTLAQIVLQQLAVAEGVSPSPTHSFEPRQFFGAAQQSKHTIDDYLLSAREGWL